MKFVNENEPDTVAPYLAPYFESVSVQAISASVARYRAIDAWNSNMSMTESSFNRLQDIIQNAGELSRRAQMNELVDNSIADKVYNEIYTT